MLRDESKTRREGGDLVLCLTKTVHWYGKATGYYQMLPSALRAVGARVDVVRPRPGWVFRCLGMLIAAAVRAPRRNQAHTLAEVEFELLRLWRRPTASLILSIEDYLPYAARPCGRLPREIIGVIHYPPSIWRQKELEMLRRFQSALILYTADIPVFERYVGKGRVRFVRHGVDTDFFRPAGRAEKAAVSDGKKRILFVGQFGRDFKTFVDAVNILAERVSPLAVDVVTGHFGRQSPAWGRLSERVEVTFHQEIPDEKLRAVYQRADIMLQPLSFCAANNAIVEGLACGVPMIASDTGGIRDYGGGEVFDLTPQGDAVAMASAAGRLLGDAARRERLSVRAREFAVNELSWPVVTKEHLREIKKLHEHR